MLRAGEFDDVVALGEREFDLLEALGRDEEYGRDFPSQSMKRLIEAGLVRRAPFWGYALTTRGQLIVTRGRVRASRRTTFLDGLSRLRWPKPR